MINIHCHNIFTWVPFRFLIEEVVSISGAIFCLIIFISFGSVISVFLLTALLVYLILLSLKTKKYFIQIINGDREKLYIRCYKWNRIYIDQTFSLSDVKISVGDYTKKFRTEYCAHLEFNNESIKIFQDLAWNTSRFELLQKYCKDVFKENSSNSRESE